MYLLRGEVSSDGAATNYISQAESELERISGITKQTLRWNRETGKPEVFEMNLLVDEVLRLFTGKIRNKQIRVSREGEAGTAGWGIIGQIRQVLANLVSNAIDAAPLGGTMIIRLQQREGETGFVVHNDGPGMSRAIQNRLFEPFSVQRAILGMGLGSTSRTRWWRGTRGGSRWTRMSRQGRRCRSGCRGIHKRQMRDFEA